MGRERLQQLDTQMRGRKRVQIDITFGEQVEVNVVTSIQDARRAGVPAGREKS